MATELEDQSSDEEQAGIAGGFIAQLNRRKRRRLAEWLRQQQKRFN